MTATAAVGLRIGEVAKLVGTTTRTIRYYEEIGLLDATGDREAGRHRLYGEHDVERLRDALRFKELLGVSLDELKALLEAEQARASFRNEWYTDRPGPPRQREMFPDWLRHLDRQLELVRRRAAQVAELEQDLSDRRERLLALMQELDGPQTRA